VKTSQADPVPTTWSTTATFWSTLTTEAQVYLLGRGAARVYAADTVLIEPWRAATVLILVDGVACTELVDERGHTSVTFHRDGELLGAAAALGRVSPLPVTSIVRSRSRMQALSFSGAVFSSILNESAEITRALLADLAAGNEREMLRRARGGLPVPDRVRLFLEELAYQFGRPLTAGAVEIRFELSQHDIATAVGASPRAVEQALRGLRQQHAVSTGYRRMIVYPALLAAGLQDNHPHDR
jgi:CRP-like cAMP-binding protein